MSTEEMIEALVAEYFCMEDDDCDECCSGCKRHLRKKLEKLVEVAKEEAINGKQ